MTITNTKTQDPAILLATILNAGDNAIEQMEAAGQAQLVRSNQLPTAGLLDGRHGGVAEALGIQVLGASAGDDIFSDVELPEGWRIVATGHSMWSEIMDEKDVVRASIFYKAAHYDRSANIVIVEGEDK